MVERNRKDMPKDEISNNSLYVILNLKFEYKSSNSDVIIAPT